MKLASLSEIKDEFPETASSNMSLNQNDAQMEMLSSPSLQPKSEFGLFHQQKHGKFCIPLDTECVSALPFTAETNSVTIQLCMLAS